jgi:hypothetical protein
MLTAHAAQRPVSGTGSETAALGGAVGARRLGLAGIAAAMALGVALLGLFARIMAYPLRHDEQMYLPVGAVLSEGALYQDFGFNNLPNLPLLMAGMFAVSGTDHYLLAGRLVIVALWLLAAVAMALVVHRATASRAAAVLAVLALLTSPPLLGAAGMLVTNNFAPIPFALLGTHLFIVGLDRTQPSFPALLASGACLAVAAGFKANFIFLLPPFALAMLLVPRGLVIADRAVSVILPVLLGALIGALPVLMLAAPDPDGFVAHVLRYHRGPHMAYWLANPDLDGPKVMSLGGKLQLAENVWFNGSTLLLLVACLYLAFAGGLRNVGPPAGRARWPVWLVAGLVAGAAVVSFVPTPAFPQYYVAPIPFLIVLAALLYGRLDPHRRALCAPFIQAVVGVTILIGAPRLLLDLPSLLRPGQWTGVRAHAAGRDIAAAMTASGNGRLATLAPLYALEAGRPIYPQLAAGPLVYRVGDLIPPNDRQYYSLVSPTTVGRLLQAEPPAGILVGYEGELDAPLEAFALRHRYRRVDLPSLKSRNGQGVLFVREFPVADG